MQTIYLEAILMDNDEIISNGKTIGWRKDFLRESIKTKLQVEKCTFCQSCTCRINSQRP